VYAIRPGPPTFEGLAWAGILLGGPQSRLGGEAAAHLHGLTPEPPGSLDVLVPPTARGSTRPPWVFTREQPGFRSPRSPGQPPRLTLEDTVLDLCDGADVREIVGWVTQAVTSRRTTVVRLRRALEARSRHSRRRLLDELLGDVAEGVESPLELRYLRDVERAHGLPKGNRQNVSRVRDRRDVVYRQYGLVVELDGRLGHEGLGRFRDMRRDNDATVDGEATLRYGSVDVNGEPCLVARQVAEVLVLRGWRGEFRLCARCS
jgi:hypothetical protein